MRDLYDNYVKTLITENVFNKNKNIWELKNPWAEKKSSDFWNDCYKKIEQSGLKFDAKHITINQNGVSYEYVAYKNKMLLAYPETAIDVELVYKDDVFAFEKTNGVVDYKHMFSNPFNHKDPDIVGGYCVIKNKRGEFITILSKEEIDKAKAVAKTKAIWDAWYSEMCKKTVIKKAVKFHFDDIYQEMEEEDNKNYDLEEQTEKPELQEALKNAILEADNLQTLKNIYDREYLSLETVSLKAEFLSLLTQRKKELKNANS